MDRDSYVYKTPASKLVQVAAIAAEYKGRPDMLMTAIIRAQKVVSAFSKEVASVIAREMDIPMNKVYSFITFYAMLSVKPRGATLSDVQERAVPRTWGAGSRSGAGGSARHQHRGRRPRTEYSLLEYCPCLGLCEISPSIMINEHVYGNLTPESVILSNNIYGRMWNSMEEMHVLLKTAARLIREVHRSMRTAADLKR